VITFPADLAQFWGSGGDPPPLKTSGNWSFVVHGIMLDILQQMITGYLHS